MGTEVNFYLIFAMVSGAVRGFRDMLGIRGFLVRSGNEHVLSYVPVFILSPRYAHPLCAAHGLVVSTKWNLNLFCKEVHFCKICTCSDSP